MNEDTKNHIKRTLEPTISHVTDFNAGDDSIEDVDVSPSHPKIWQAEQADFLKVIASMVDTTLRVDGLDKTETEGKPLVTGSGNHRRDLTYFNDQASAIGGNHQSDLTDFNDCLSATVERVKAGSKRAEELDACVAKAARIRQDEHADLLRVTASNAGNSQVPVIAVNRFTAVTRLLPPITAELASEDPVKEYKAPAKVELASEDRVYANPASPAPMCLGLCVSRNPMHGPPHRSLKRNTRK